MWTLLCAVLFIELSFPAAFPILEPVEDILIPFEDNSTEIQDKCRNVQCPKLRCSTAVLKEGDCCFSCDTSEDTLGCVLEGKAYEELAMVPSNSSDPCEVCHCCIGELVCSTIFQSCPQLNCDIDQIVVEEGKCCPRCTDENNINLEPEQAACKQNGITYKDGDVWNPYFPKFGVLKCQNCTCKNGNVICDELSCPPVRECTDDDPIEETIICCPKCNRTLTNVTETRNDTYVPPILQPTSPDSKPCNSVITHAYRVYKTIDESIDQIAIESLHILNVDVYVWSNDTSQALWEAYTSKTFADLFADVRFIYTGDTTEELVKTLRDWFSAKENKYNLNYCKYLCASRVISLLQPRIFTDSTDSC